MKLSIEECCYWAVLAGASLGVVEAIAFRDRASLLAWYDRAIRESDSYERDDDQRMFSFIRMLLVQAMDRINEEQTA